MTQELSLMTKIILGPGAIMEDANPTPTEFRANEGAKSLAPVEEITLLPIDLLDDDNPLHPL